MDAHTATHGTGVCGREVLGACGKGGNINSGEHGVAMVASWQTFVDGSSDGRHKYGRLGVLVRYIVAVPLLKILRGVVGSTLLRA